MEWLIADDTGALLGEPCTGTLAEAAGSAEGRRVIALVSAAQVTSRRIDLPIRGRAKILQALPFALEEHVAEDVDELHFSAGKPLPDGQVPVAAVRREKMDAWLAALRQVEIEPNAIYADADLLDDLPGSAVLLLEPRGASMRDTTGRTFAFDTDSLDTVLELWLEREADSSGEDDNDEVRLRPHLQVFSDAGSAQTCSPALDAIAERLASMDIVILGDGALARMALHVNSGKATNLLQGDYARKSDLSALWPAWRLSCGLAAVALVLALALNVARLFELERTEAQLDTTLNEAFQATFPDIGEIRDPRAQLDSRLRALAQRGADPGSGFLDGVTALSGALAGTSDATIETMSYRAGVIDVRVTVASVETLDQVTRHIEENSTLSAAIQSANPGSKGVEGRLQIKLAGGGA